MCRGCVCNGMQLFLNVILTLIFINNLKRVGQPWQDLDEQKPAETLLRDESATRKVLTVFISSTHMRNIRPKPPRSDFIVICNHKSEILTNVMSAVCSLLLLWQCW